MDDQKLVIYHGPLPIVIPKKEDGEGDYALVETSPEILEALRPFAILYERAEKWAEKQVKQLGGTRTEWMWQYICQEAKISKFYEAYAAVKKYNTWKPGEAFNDDK